MQLRPIPYRIDALSGLTVKRLRQIASSWVLLVPRTANKADLIRILAANGR